MHQDIADELENAMLDCGGFVSEVFELIDDMNSSQIAKHFGHKTSWNVEKHLHAIDMIFDPTLAENHGKQVHTYAKSAVNRILDVGVSDDLRNHLYDVLDTQHRAAPYISNGSAAQRAAKRRPQIAGVYVYTYPQYLLTEILTDDQRTLYKVGASQATERRLERQRRETEVPEDIEIIRIYPTEMPFEDEAHFHTILKAAGQHHKTTRAGTEWFRTSLPMLDAIADALDLAIQYPMERSTNVIR